MYYLYILNCKGNRLYTGITTDMQRRFSEHMSGHRSSSFTKSFPPVALLALWELPHNRGLAQQAEAWVKKQNKAFKESLCHNPQSLCDTFSDFTPLDVSQF